MANLWARAMSCRHLELLGFKLSYSQSPLMGIPLPSAIWDSRLADGIRLIKVAEVLTGARILSTTQQAGHS